MSTANYESPAQSLEGSFGSKARSVLTFRTDDLRLSSGIRLGELKISDKFASTYYGKFLEHVGSPDGTKTFLDALSASARQNEAFKLSLLYRAKIALVSKDLGLNFSEAIQVLPLLESSKIQLTISQATELVAENYLELRKGVPHKIVVSIDRYGLPFIREGHHRAIINLATGNDFTNTIVIRRDEEWISLIQFFKEESQRLYNRDFALYHPIEHPDFDDWVVLRENRSLAVINFLDSLGLHRGIDFGSMIGSIAYDLARSGKLITAVEYDKNYAMYGRVLGRFYGLEENVNFIESDVYDFDLSKNDPDAQFAIMLSLAYHLIRRDKSRFVEWLDWLKRNIPVFIVDTEERTGTLGRSELLGLFKGFDSELVHSGSDGREIYGFRCV